ncbi:MAG: 30S ribosomal protein S13 [bacterium]|nr:30S ribosomal protein S13 [bacterium]MBU1919143.1 30S ribosomal protein S13 [bacterium]
MPRIAGVNIPGNKKLPYALQYIYGIGKTFALEIVEKTGINPETRADDLNDDEMAKIRYLLENDYTVEGELRRDITMNIRRLMEIGSYRGIRHRKGLPVNGQRTKTNARTRKGPRKTVAGKKKAPTSK